MTSKSKRVGEARKTWTANTSKRVKALFALLKERPPKSSLRNKRPRISIRKLKICRSFAISHLVTFHLFQSHSLAKRIITNAAVLSCATLSGNLGALERSTSCEASSSKTTTRWRSPIKSKVRFSSWPMVPKSFSTHMLTKANLMLSDNSSNKKKSQIQHPTQELANICGGFISHFSICGSHHSASSTD
jgi:hypothetical protein